MIPADMGIISKIIETMAKRYKVVARHKIGHAGGLIIDYTIEPRDDYRPEARAW